MNVGVDVLRSKEVDVYLTFQDRFIPGKDVKAHF